MAEDIQLLMLEDKLIQQNSTMLQSWVRYSKNVTSYILLVTFM